MATKIKVGEGSFATVYKMRMAKTRVCVAFKVFKASEDAAELCKYEIKMLKRVGAHENVIENLDYIIEPTPTIVFEIMDMSLDKYLKRMQLVTSDRAFSILGMLLRGLAHVHAMGVMHRDIKPENLLVSRDGTVLKIADFGLSKDVEDEPHTNVVVTLGYRCEELLMGAICYGPEIDMWSVGVVFLELFLGGSRLFSGSYYPMKHLDEVKAFLFDPSSRFPPQWGHAETRIASGLICGPKRRWTAKQALNELS